MSSWFCVFAYDCVKRALHFDLCRWQPAHTHYHSLLAVSFGGVRCYSKRSSFWILGYFDHWLARSACRQRVSLLLLLALLSPCMSSMAMFLGTIARASLCLHFTFLWRRRCMLWIDFCADNKLNGNKENECFCSTLCVTLCHNDTLTVLERAHDLPLRMFLWSITTVTIMKNTRTHTRPVEQNLLFAILLVDHVPGISLIAVLVELLHVQACVFTSLSEVHAIDIFWWLFCRWTGVLIILIARAIFCLH